MFKYTLVFDHESGCYRLTAANSLTKKTETVVETDSYLFAVTILGALKDEAITLHVREWMK